MKIGIGVSLYLNGNGGAAVILNQQNVDVLRHYGNKPSSNGEKL